MTEERRAKVEAAIQRSREALDRRVARWASEVDRLIFPLYEDEPAVGRRGTPLVREAVIQRHERQTPETPEDNVVAAANRFGGRLFASAMETHAALAASDQLHTFVLDLSHFVGGNVTVRLNAAGEGNLDASFDAPEELSVGIMVHETGELLGLVVEGQAVDLIAVRRPMASVDFAIDLRSHHWSELVLVAYV